MSENLYIPSSHNTPEIDFNVEKGVFKICGKSVMENVEDFYSPVIEWLEANIEQSAIPLRFVFNLEYFNISSSKRLLFILYRINDFHSAGKEVVIEWNYNEDDDDMKEVGEDFACMVNVPFEFNSYTSEDLLR
jgi:hypothetical protein